MPQYHFASINGHRERDDEGTCLPDDTAARNLGTQYAAEILASEPELLWENGKWRVEISDGEGVLLFSIETRVVQARGANAVVYV